MAGNGDAAAFQRTMEIREGKERLDLRSVLTATPWGPSGPGKPVSPIGPRSPCRRKGDSRRVSRRATKGPTCGLTTQRESEAAKLTGSPGIPGSPRAPGFPCQSHTHGRREERGEACLTGPQRCRAAAPPDCKRAPTSRPQPRMESVRLSERRLWRLCVYWVSASIAATWCALRIAIDRFARGRLKQHG